MGGVFIKLGDELSIMGMGGLEGQKRKSSCEFYSPVTLSPAWVERLLRGVCQ